MHSDPIADLLTRIRNAVMAKHEAVSCPWSTIKENIVRLLVKNGYLEKYSVVENAKGFKDLLIELKPAKKEIHIKRLSKPGHRVYVDINNIPNVLRGYGMAVISTSKGIMTNKEAKKENIGGELLLEIW